MLGIPELQRTQSEILFDPKKSRNIGTRPLAANAVGWCGARLTMARAEIIMKRGSLRADGIRNAVMAFQLAGDDLDSARSLLATFPSQAEVSSSPTARTAHDPHAPHTTD